MAGHRSRGNGEGSIYQRKDGVWCAALFETGSRRVLYGKTRQDVVKKLRQALTNHEMGLPVIPERVTVGQYLDQWLAETVRPSVRPSTHASYSRIVGHHIKPAIGALRLAKLSPPDVQTLINRLTEQGRKVKGRDKSVGEGLSPRTAQYTRAILRRALGQALKWGLVARNVATLVDSPRVERPEITPFNPEEARTFLEAVRGDRLEALYTVAIALGLRQGEALGLRWQDLDLEAGTLRVSVQLQRVDGRLTFVEPKTKKARRTIRLPAIALGALRDHRRRQLEERLLAGDRWQDHGLVFATRAGKPIDAINLIREFRRHLDRAKIRTIRFHDLRHTCATLLLVQGIHPRVVMDVLGHSQISTTLDVYSHVLPTLQEEAAAKMDGVLAGVGGRAIASFRQVLKPLRTARR